MKKDHQQILRTLGVIGSAACWISLGAVLACQVFQAGATLIQVCGSIG